MEYKNYVAIDLFSRVCQHCNKPLRMIGIQRKNGKELYKDWNSRKFHKKCYYIFLVYIICMKLNSILIRRRMSWV